MLLARALGLLLGMVFLLLFGLRLLDRWLGFLRRVPVAVVVVIAVLITTMVGVRLVVVIVVVVVRSMTLLGTRL